MMSNYPGQPGRHTLSLPALLGMAAMLAFLYGYPLPRMTSLTLPLAVIALGWVVYLYLEPLRLLQRHAYLAALTTRESWIRRWLWQGFFLRLRLVVTALAVAVIALLYGATIRPLEWLIVLTSVPLFLVLFMLASRLLRSQLAPRYHFPLALRWACRGTLLLLVCALMVWQVYWLEVPATQHAPLADVLRSAFERGAAVPAMPRLGAALGISAALDAGIWHLMQVTTIAGASRWVYLGAWAGVLAWSALKVGALWTLLLGAVTLTERLRTDSRQAAGDGGTLMAFALVVATAGTAYLGAARLQLQQPAALVDPCAAMAGAGHARLVADARQRLDRQQRAFNSTMNNVVNTRIDAAYALAGQGVDQFLDWNFSLRGQYQQLGWVLTAGVTDLSLADRVGRQIDKYVLGPVAPVLKAVGADMETELRGQVNAAYEGQEVFLSNWLAGAECLDLPRPDLRLAGTAWLATDLALNQVDEALNRARMRAELLAAIEAEKEALTFELTRHYSQIAAWVFSDIERRQVEVFNLYRDGGRVQG